MLFLCSQNRLRSPTAEQVFADWPGIETASAGLGNDAEVQISYMDLHLLAEELSEYAHDITVLAPIELSKAIRTRFEAVANAHA